MQLQNQQMDSKFMKNLTLLSAVTAATVALPLMASQASAAILTAKVLDPLTNVQGVSTSTTGDSPTNGPLSITGDFGAVGRTLTLTNVTAGGANFADLSVPISPTIPGIAFSNGVGVDSVANILYSFASPIDLAMGMGMVSNPDRFTLDLRSADFGGNIGLSINGGATVFKPFSGGNSGSNPSDDQFIDFFFSELTGENAVTSLAIIIDPDNVETDVSVQFIGTRGEMDVPSTPEPATLLGLAVFGAAGFVSRRRQK